MRRVKNDTGYFFDSFKHFKNNMLNLITLELTTLDASEDLNSYLNLKSVNYKSKLADMKKIGIIDYRKPGDNEFYIKEEGIELLEIFKKHAHHFNYEINETRNKSVSIEEINHLLTKDEIKKMNRSTLKLLLSYYDSSDFIRPYLLLIKYINKENYNHITDDVFKMILAQRKIDILNNDINPYAYEILDKQTQEQLNRPISYIKNYLYVSGVLNKKNEVVLDKNMMKDLLIEIEEVNIYNYISDPIRVDSKTRSSISQRQFREEVLANYNYMCAISGKPISFKRGNSDSQIIILEAAHIIPYSEGGSFSISNGIALTPELHKLFDLGLFTFKYIDSKTLKIVVSQNESIEDNGLLKKISEKTIELDGKTLPDPIAIQYREKVLI